MDSVNLKPIPSFLLKDYIVLRQYKGEDDRENPIYEDVILKNIYIRFNKGKTVTQNGLVENDLITVFFDSENSLPVNQMFDEKDKLIMNNAQSYGFRDNKRDFSITNIKRAAFNHHWEIGAK